MKEENEEKAGQPEEKEIDLMELVYKLWSERKLIFLWCLAGAIAGLVIAFSIPREYSTSVTLAPEVKTNGRSLATNLGALARLAGISTAGNAATDAMYPQLYPEIVGSVPFLTSLFDVPVKDKNDSTYTVREFLEEETTGPWWGVVMSLPGKMIGLLMPKEEINQEGEHVLDNFRLTKKEFKLVNALRARIVANVDQKTQVITISTKMQDPVISAILADTVVARLREYVTDYRTDKSRQDLEYAEKLNAEAKEEYYKAQQNLADYIDRNQNLATQSARITRDRLQNESSLAFNLYNETALQVQNAKSKVQETTPVYTEITPATVPLRPSAPRRALILIAFVFLAFVGCCAWILFGEPMVGQYKSKVKAMKEAESTSNNPDKDKKD